MYKFLAKNGPMFAFLGAAVFVLIAIIPVLIGLSSFNAIDSKQQPFSAEGDIFKIGIYLTIGLLILAVMLAILLGVFNIFTNFKDSIKGLVVFGIVALLFVVLIFTASTTGSESFMRTVDTFQVSSSMVKVIGGGISLAMLMAIGSVVVIAIMEVLNFFKNQ